MRSLLRVAALGVALAASGGPAALSQTAPPEAEAMFRATTLSLSADGEVDVTPDMATISLGVATQAPAAGEAMQANAAEMTRVIGALRRAGVEARDIRTAQLSLSPQYAYEQGQPPRLSGYQATNQVVVTARDLKRLGQVVDAAVAAGANAAGGISFDLLDRRPAEDAARLAAVKALQAKADLYARATGYRVARLVNLGEGAEYNPPGPIPMVAGALAKRAATPVSEGEMKVRIAVSGTFELTRAQ